jgi:hypothetical protein
MCEEMEGNKILIKIYNVLTKSKNNMQFTTLITEEVQFLRWGACIYSPTETLVEFGFGCKFNNNNRRIRFYYQVITVVINTTTTTCNIPA